MLTIQEMSDRLEIQALIARYAYAIDDKAWDKLDLVFTPDATIDYTEVGGPRGTPDEIKQHLSQAMDVFPMHQHLCATSEIAIDGNNARVRTILFNPMRMKTADVDQIIFIGLWYCDDLIRTHDGWRITSRHLKKSWNYNVPEGVVPD